MATFSDAQVLYPLMSSIKHMSDILSRYSCQCNALQMFMAVLYLLCIVQSFTLTVESKSVHKDDVVELQPVSPMSVIGVIRGYLILLILGGEVGCLDSV